MASQREEIEEALASIGRIRVFTSLAEDPEKWFTLYEIVKKSGLKRTDAKRNLTALAQINWVNAYGDKIVKYRINRANSVTRLFLEFLRQAGYFSQ